MKNLHDRLALMQSLIDQGQAHLDEALKTYPIEYVLRVFIHAAKARSIAQVPEDMREAYMVSSLMGMASCLQRLAEAQVAELDAKP